MLGDIDIKKIEFENRDEPINIFFKKTFKGYYLRGQIKEVRFPMCLVKGEPLKKRAFLVHYITILTLVNDSYLDRHYGVSFFGFLSGRNKEEYLKLRRKCDTQLKKQFRAVAKKAKKHHGDIIIKHNKPLVFDFEVGQINMTSDLRKSIKAKKEIILLDVDMDFIREEPDNLYSKSVNFDINRKYALAFWLLASPDCCDDDPVTAHNWSFDLYQTITINIDHNLTTINEFHELIADIHFFAFECYDKKRISKKSLESLNSLVDLKGEKDCPLRRFVNSILDDFINFLIEKKRIMKCPICYHYYKYKKSKPACNLNDDGRDCISEYNAVRKNPVMKKLLDILQKCSIEEKLSLEQAVKFCINVHPYLYTFFWKIYQDERRKREGKSKSKKADIIEDIYKEFEIDKLEIEEETFERKLSDPKRRKKA